MDMNSTSSYTLFSTRGGDTIYSVIYRKNSNSTFILLGDGTIRFVGQIPEYKERFPHAPPLPVGLRYVSIEEDASGVALIAEISNGDMIICDNYQTDSGLDLQICHRGCTAITSQAWMTSKKMLYDSRMSIVSGDGGYWKMSKDQNNCPNWIWHATPSPVVQIASAASKNTYASPVVLLKDGSLCQKGSEIADFVPEDLKFSGLITTSSFNDTENKHVIGVMENGMAIQLSPHEEHRRIKLCKQKDAPILLPTPGHKVIKVEHRRELIDQRYFDMLVQHLEAEDGSVVVTNHYAPNVKRHASRIPVSGRAGALGQNYKKFCSQHATEEWHSLMREIVAKNPDIRPWVPMSAMKHGNMRSLIGLIEI